MYVDTVNPVEFKIIGKDLKEFLQGLITNNINNIDKEPVETFILTPQGKIKHQIKITDKGDGFSILCTNDQSDLFASGSPVTKCCCSTCTTPGLNDQ